MTPEDRHAPSPYRADIDGLRAIAVLAVALFHGNPAWLPGGYLGVDIFFVISGYLIARIALFDLGRGNFSWRHFYERRIRRLLPALLVMLCITTAAAFALMQPLERAAYGRSLTAALAWVSNVYFWRTSTYFGEAAHNTALLHTWSLAVEEQFYLLFPLLLAWLTNSGTAGRPVRKICSLLLLTLMLAIWASRVHPNAAFYLLPFRAWELLAGVALAFVHVHAAEPPTSCSANQGLSALALALLLFSLTFGAPETSHLPAPAANLLVVLGTAALIHLGRDSSNIVQQLLASRPLVHIGLVSYSLYLWHQPILSLARLQFGSELPAGITLSALLVSSGVAALSWRFVEQPWRRPGSSGPFWGGILALTLLLGTAGFWWHFNLGQSKPPTEWQRQLLSIDFDTREAQGVGSCFLRTDQPPTDFAACVMTGSGSRRALIWGDSHGAHLAPGLMVYGNWFSSITQRHVSGCAGIVPIDSDPSWCRAARNFVLAEIKRAPPDHVLLASRWRTADVERLVLTVNALKALGVREVSVVGPMPRWRGGLPGWLAQDANERPPSQQVATELVLPHAAPQAALNNLLRRALQDTDARYVDALAFFCPRWPRCTTSVDGSIEGVVAWDADHLTRAGSNFMARKLAVQLAATPHH